MIMVVVMTSEETTSKLGCVSISLIALLFSSFVTRMDSGIRDRPLYISRDSRRFDIGRDLGGLLLFRLNRSSHLSVFGSIFMSHEHLQ